MNRTTFATLASDLDGEPIVAVLVKQTWDILPNGGTRRSEGQLPLVLGDRDDSAPEPAADPCEELLEDLDVWPVKRATDVVVKGRVWAPRAKPVAALGASVQVGRHGKALQVYGDRFVERSAGSLRFTPPTPFESIELSYRRAYGGIDASLRAPDPQDLAQLLEFLTPELHPGAYPRNPAGVGYIITGDPRIVEGHRLPNFEDPRKLLRPETLLVGHPERWWQMPMPAGFGWIHPGWYPRSSFLGMLTRHAPPDHLDVLEEVRLGLVPRGQHARVSALAMEDRMDWRFSNGAPAGLALPFLEGGEPVCLQGLSPTGEIRFELPRQRPAVRVRFEGRELSTEVVLHTLAIDAEARRFTMVHAARARTPDKLHERLPSADDTHFDSLEGLHITVDGAVLEHAPEALIA